MNCFIGYGRKEDKYEWTQSPDEVTVTIQLPVKGLKAKDLDIVMKANHLKVAIKAKEADPIINVRFTAFFEISEFSLLLE